MPTSLLYHGWNLRGYRHLRTEFQDGTILFGIEQPREKYCCSHCGSKNVHSRGTVTRRWRCLPIGHKPVFLEFAVPRLKCFDCGRTRQVRLQFADPQKQYTRCFERYVLELGRLMTIQGVAGHLGLSWDVVKDIQKRNLQKHFARSKLRHQRRLAIDEICIGRGHRYLTLVLDLDQGAVVYVGRGKRAEALEPFWRRLKAARAYIEAVAVDMSPAYIQAVREHLPQAALVFDRFHVIKLSTRN